VRLGASGGLWGTTDLESSLSIRVSHASNVLSTNLSNVMTMNVSQRCGTRRTSILITYNLQQKLADNR
jgi:spore coat protein U-like protein